MTFWDWFFLFMIYIPLMIIWVVTLVDIFSRPDLSGWAKALWTVALFVIPWLGVFVYLIARPPEAPGAWSARPRGVEGYPAPAPGIPTPLSTAQELEKLANLRREGVLTEDEYSAAKAKVIAASQPGGRAA